MLIKFNYQGEKHLSVLLGKPGSSESFLKFSNHYSYNPAIIALWKLPIFAGRYSGETSPWLGSVDIKVVLEQMSSVFENLEYDEFDKELIDIKLYYSEKFKMFIYNDTGAELSKVPLSVVESLKKHLPTIVETQTIPSEFESLLLDQFKHEIRCGSDYIKIGCTVISFDQLQKIVECI